MGHNVWHHINAVQTANELYDQGVRPGMLAGEHDQQFDFRNIVDDIFRQKDRQRSLERVEYYERAFDLIIGTRGFTGKRLVSARPMFDALFEIEEEPPKLNIDDLDSDKLDALEQSL
jgi:hypothetical protein